MRLTLCLPFASDSKYAFNIAAASVPSAERVRNTVDPKRFYSHTQKFHLNRVLVQACRKHMQCFELGNLRPWWKYPRAASFRPHPLSPKRFLAPFRWHPEMFGVRCI